MAFKFSAEFSNSPQFVGEKPRIVNWRGIELTVASENIEKPTVWSIKENRHALIVHLGGKINEIETEIDRRSSKLNPPTAGEFWLIPANAEYFSFTRGETVNYAEIYFEPDYLEKLLGESGKDYELKPHVGLYDNFLYQNVKQLTSLITKTDDISELMGDNISQTLCLYLFSNYNSQVITSDKQTIKLSQRKHALLQEYIQENLAEQITLEKLAKVAEINSHKLLRLFSTSFNSSPAQYIIKQRLRKVRFLLSNTKQDITTIALATGFSSHSHLTTTFKKHTGITPAEFRNSF